MPNGTTHKPTASPRRSRPKATRTTKPVTSLHCKACGAAQGRPHIGNCKADKRCTADGKHFGACVRWAGHSGGHSFKMRPGDAPNEALVTK